MGNDQGREIIVRLLTNHKQGNLKMMFESFDQGFCKCHKTKQKQKQKQKQNTHKKHKTNKTLRGSETPHVGKGFKPLVRWSANPKVC